MSTSTLTRSFTTKDINGRHIAEGMFVYHRHTDSTVVVHRVTESGDVTVYPMGQGVPLTTRGAFLEVVMVNIKCAHCKGYHPSVGQVRDCATSYNAVKVFSEPLPPVEPSAYVPAGRYAIEVDGVVKFYVVRRPEEGRWAGRTFIDIQAGDDFHKVGSSKQRRTILHIIGLDPKEAMLRYGHEIGSCGHCGRTLTNEVSRAAGIGPVCREKMGW